MTSRLDVEILKSLYEHFGEGDFCFIDLYKERKYIGRLRALLNEKSIIKRGRILRGGSFVSVYRLTKLGIMIAKGERLYAK